MNETKNCLVTGSAGFIGSALTKRLMDEGYNVFSVDSFSDYYSIELKKNRLKEFQINSKSNFLNIDLKDKSDIRKLIRELHPNLVVHLAAQPGVRLSRDLYNKYTINNILAFENLILSCIKEGVDNLVYASSSSVYGNSARIPYSEYEVKLEPKSYYGYTKLINEKMIKYYFEDFGTRVRGLRFFSVYGPWGRPDMAYFRICSHAVSGSQFTKFGDGTVERDFTYIDDVIQATYLLIEDLLKREVGFKDIVNVGGGEPSSVNNIMKTVTFFTKQELSYVEGKNNPADVEKTHADADYLQNLIRYKPDTPLETGLRNVLSWMQNDEVKKNLGSWINSCQ